MRRLPDGERQRSDAMTKFDAKKNEEKIKNKPRKQEQQNPPSKTSTNNPERNPRDQKGRGGSK
jgi:hypothetical protein